MGKKIYKAADLQIITEGSIVDFDLFVTNETKTAMSVLVAKNSIIDGTMKVRLREIEKLYFDAEDSHLYNIYVSNHLQSITKNQIISIAQKAQMVYPKAEEAINVMFENPELGDCVSVVLDDLGKSKAEYEIINKNGKLDEYEMNVIKNIPRWTIIMP